MREALGSGCGQHGVKIADVNDSTNFLDKAATSDASYAVAAIVGGKVLERSDAVTPRSQNYVDMPLSKPADGVTPAGQAYSYEAGDMSLGDVDGDGAYEYVVRWEPTNAKDVSLRGYTGNTYIDTYTMAGKLLHRIDLGVNIRSGATTRSSWSTTSTATAAPR